MTDDAQAESAIARLSTPPQRALRTVRALFGVALVLSLAITIVVLSSVVSSLNKARAIDSEVAACRSVLAADITEAQAAATKAATQVVAELARSVAASLADGTRFDPAATTAAIDASDQLTLAVDVPVEARARWLAAGSPLPCPAQPD